MALTPSDLGDAAKQTSSTTGTGAYSLDGAAVAPYRSLKTAMIERTGDAVGPWKIARYVAADGLNRESASGTLTAGTPDTLTRDKIWGSTNGNAAVNWGGGGVRDIWIAPDADFIMMFPGATEESTLIIAAGAIIPRHGQHAVDTEAAAATDDLDTIDQTHLPEGAHLLIRPVNAGRVVTVRHNQGATGKILTRDAASVALDSTSKYLELKREGTTWVEVDRCGFAAELATVNRFTKIQKWALGADVAAAATLTLGEDGNTFNITGVGGPIAAIAAKGVGTEIKLIHGAAHQLTHHATNLILLSGASIPCAAGDISEWVEYAVGQWRMTDYAKANGQALVAPATVASATQAEQEAATSTTTYVSPGRQHFHPSAAKVWVNYAGSTGTVNGSYNVSSVTNTGAGDETVNFTTALSAATFAAAVSAGVTPGLSNARVVSTGSFAVGSLQLATNNLAGLADAPNVCAAIFGDI